MADETTVDKEHAIKDKASISTTSKYPLEGWIDTPYVKVLFSEYFYQSSRLCAMNMGQEIVDYENKIRKLYSALEMKVGNIEQITEHGSHTTNIRGYAREVNAITNFRNSIFETIEEKEIAIKNWRSKIMSLVDTYNNRVAVYLDEVLANKAVIIDYPKLDVDDIPDIIQEELDFCKQQRTNYEKRIDRLMSGEDDGDRRASASTGPRAGAADGTTIG
jgi:hypothetical protein